MGVTDEDNDVEVQLQRVSARVIQELQISIPLFLRKNHPGNPSHERIRRFVKQSSTAKIERLVDTFQEWPQLLDPTLERVVQPLVTAFVEYLHAHAKFYRERSRMKPADPLPRAICKILYTLCKVRGPKVIARFFTNEPATLEPMLDAFDLWNHSAQDGKFPEQLIWEEKYAMLLWLSHLTLTPFDLESISTPDEGKYGFLPGKFSIPPKIPVVARRLLALGLRYISSASKEREAAVSLLVRLSLRPDMQHLQLHRQFVEWVLSSLADPVDGNTHDTTYFHAGILSYLADFLRSGDSRIVASFLYPIFQCMQAITVKRVGTADDILGSAVVRKLVIKIHRHLALHLHSYASSSVINQFDDPDLLGSIIDYLLISLGDKDNPVRLTASKSVSVVAQRLDKELTSQLVDDIAQRLKENTVFERPETFTTDNGIHGESPATARRGLSAVDPLNWHGLVLTLSHLIFRHCAPQENLSTIIGLLVDALDFEQRSPTGTSHGAGVRDAACFGIWSLARKYSTAELLCIPTSNVHPRALYQEFHSVIEFLAAELVITATLDPEGNIRRGASAALQELVGRHPDLVPNGIGIIQVVDYHAVGLRSRAMNDVTLQAAALGALYLKAISVGMFSWRAIKSPIAAVRRDAADVVGHIIRLYSHDSTILLLLRLPMASDNPMAGQLETPRQRTIDEWHGLYLAHAAAIREGCFKGSVLVRCLPTTMGNLLLLEDHGIFGIKDIVAHGKESELAIEALCMLLVAASSQSRHNIMLDQARYEVDILHSCIKHCTGQTLDVVRSAAASVIGMLEEQGQQLLIRSWLLDVQGGRNDQLRSGGSNVNLITMIGTVLQLPELKAVPADLMALQIDILVALLSNGSRIDTKCAVFHILQCHCWATDARLDLYLKLNEGGDHSHLKEYLKRPLIDSLKDHTIDSRGDIGSEVRIAATEIISRTSEALQWDDSFSHEAFGIVYGLSVEKLDKVRGCAWSCIRSNRLASVKDMQQSASWSTTSVDYLTFMLNLGKRDRLIVPMIRGFVTIASVGSEMLVRNSRVALINFLDGCSPDEVLTLRVSLTQIIQSEVPKGRLLRPGLEVFSFLLDVDPAGQEQAPLCQWRALLEVLPQVHTSTDLPTLQALVGVYAGLIQYPSIRLTAADALWMAVSNPMLKTLDLSQPASILRPDVQEALKFSQRAIRNRD
ncbi:MAG: hypothetical protein Q9178_006574 [Gyalolechia marmorata]